MLAQEEEYSIDNDQHNGEFDGRSRQSCAGISAAAVLANVSEVSDTIIWSAQHAT